MICGHTEIQVSQHDTKIELIDAKSAKKYRMSEISEKYLKHCRADETDLVLELLNSDFDASIKDYSGRTGLLYVCINGNSTLLNRFLQYPQIMNKLTLNCLLSFICQGHVDIFDIIVKFNPKLLSITSLPLIFLR